MQPIIEIDSLTKYFGNTHALDNISCTIPQGSICGMLGPNGAGKTTILRIINSLLVADKGSVLIDNQPASISTSRLLGYMPEERGLYDKMTIEDQIMYFGKLKGGESKLLRQEMDKYLKLFRLNGMERRRIKELSKGNQQKVQIISTIVHKPKIVILDEPFSGFDPINGAILQELIGILHNSGTTVILSSHNMSAIEEMCSDIILINHGKLLLEGKLSDIKEKHRRNSILMTTRNPINLDFLMDSVPIKSVVRTDTKNWRKGFAFRLTKEADTANADIINAVSLQGEIIHFEEELPSLNDIFIRYTNEQ
ncbi:MAG: ATP-binding cassette domain-containing protein [Prevotella sp.]|nr:ATP-binding cassette domain-containing protein [Bacteroides sp.]MCM1365611.1 ATP-binding cassette domain-containing protein [Prevotella sp.]